MADIVDVVSPEQQQVEAKSFLDQQMGLALGTLKPADVAQQAAVVADVVATPADPFGLFKEKFGYDTPETAIKEIEELRAYKATPIVPEIKFENERSEKLFKAFAAGKTAEVYSFLDQELKIDKLTSAELNKDTAAEVVKLGMQLKYKDLTPNQIDYKFKKQFGTPPKPVQSATEEQEEYDARVQSWQSIMEDNEMDLIIEANMVRPELQNTKQKLVFPEIDSPVDEGYAQYRKMLADNEKTAAEATIEYQKLTPKSVETKINFKDEPNKIDFTFQYEPSAEDFSKAVEATVDEQAFWKLFNKSDGTPDREKFLRVINYARNEEKVLLEAMKQSKNATIKASLPDNSQAGGLVRQMVSAPGEQSDLDKEMERRGIRK